VAGPGMTHAPRADADAAVFIGSMAPQRRDAGRASRLCKRNEFRQSDSCQ
jgi:hypothetical protein